MIHIIEATTQSMGSDSMGQVCNGKIVLVGYLRLVKFIRSAKFEGDVSRVGEQLVSWHSDVQDEFFDNIEVHVLPIIQVSSGDKYSFHQSEVQGLMLKRASREGL